MSGNIDVTVENQLVRFVAPEPIDGNAVVEHHDGQRVGQMVIKALRRPRARLNPLLVNWVLERANTMNGLTAESSMMSVTISFFTFGKMDVVWSPTAGIQRW